MLCFDICSKHYIFKIGAKNQQKCQSGLDVVFSIKRPNKYEKIGQIETGSVKNLGKLFVGFFVCAVSSRMGMESLKGGGGEVE